VRLSNHIEPRHVLLRKGNSEVVLEPGCGGAIREFACGDIEVLRKTAGDASDDPLQFASFPLVPYANRIARGRFVAAGRSVQLPPNWDGDPYPLHGQGWRTHWQVVACGACDATLRFEGGGDDWPWRYCAEQRFHLAEGALSMELSVRNLADSPMPAMLGFHPYFPAADARLQASLPHVWMADAAALPVENVPTPADWRFEAGRRVESVCLDHCFGGWDGSAMLSWPRHTVTLEATDCRDLHVYVPRGGNFFCVEPQTAATGALNRGQNEVSLVPPGGRLAMEMILSCGVP
jgi:aldose 1-epimerase